MALGASLASGKIAVCNVVPGPGVLNASAALATAYALNAQVLFLCGQIPLGQIGRAEGVLFRFDRIRRTPSSVDAHRLVRYASRFGCADAMVEALFSAHFTDGLDIGEHALLVAIASACGLDGTASRRFLAGDGEMDAVHTDNLRAHRLGINGVPCFVISGRHAIAGAQEPEVIERLLDVAAVEAAES